MIVISFGNWNTASGRWFVRERIYLYEVSEIFKKISKWFLKRNIYWSQWTPFVKIKKRYKWHGKEHKISKIHESKSN